MNEQNIVGSISIVDASGTALLEPQPAKLSWLTYDDGRWEIKFATSHQFHVPGQEAVWLRFEDSSGRILLNLPEGVVDVVTVLATAEP
jgi:hypothetical protein